MTCILDKICPGRGGGTPVMMPEYMCQGGFKMWSFWNRPGYQSGFFQSWSKRKSGFLKFEKINNSYSISQWRTNLLNTETSIEAGCALGTVKTMPSITSLQQRTI